MTQAHILLEDYCLTQEHIDFYQKYRFIKLKDVLDEATIAFYNQVITQKVHELNVEHRPMDQRDMYDQAFLQLFNLWDTDEDIKALVFSKRLAKIATDLMQVDGVKLYHDQALYKEAGGGITPWHADQYYWPLESDKTITAWIPLQNTPLNMGPLEFSAGSHHILDGRDLAISSESEQRIAERLKVTDYEHVAQPYDIGEVSFHSGWLFHRAGANSTDQERRVMTVIYMDKDMKLKEPSNEGQINDWNQWCPGAKVGEVIETPLNPQLY